MIALGHSAFDPRMTPFMLYGAAAAALEDDTREELESFARDFAEIQGLPVITEGTCSPH